MAKEMAYNSYERSYGYGYGMEQESQQFQVRKTREANRVNITFNTRARKRAITLMMVGGLILILLVVLTAVSANLTYTNNQIEKENASITNEIQNLKVNIQSTGNIGNIEDEAAKKLGMVYPTGSQFVQVASSSKRDPNFANLLKKEAFN